MTIENGLAHCDLCDVPIGNHGQDIDICVHCTEKTGIEPFFDNEPKKTLKDDLLVLLWAVVLMTPIAGLLVCVVNT